MYSEGVQSVLVARETALAEETLELGFSSCGFGDDELAWDLPRRAKKRRKGICKDNCIARFHLSSRDLLSAYCLIFTILGT